MLRGLVDMTSDRKTFSDKWPADLRSHSTF